MTVSTTDDGPINGLWLVQLITRINELWLVQLITRINELRLVQRITRINELISKQPTASAVV